jgi:hypothetical protein
MMVVKYTGKNNAIYICSIATLESWICHKILYFGMRITKLLSNLLEKELVPTGWHNSHKTQKPS